MIKQVITRVYRTVNTSCKYVMGISHVFIVWQLQNMWEGESFPLSFLDLCTMK
ncbi:hypothetical protein ACFL6S_13460 [Candidatus Poribacteria bacterium]